MVEEFTVKSVSVQGVPTHKAVTTWVIKTVHQIEKAVLLMRRKTIISFRVFDKDVKQRTVHISHTTVITVRSIAKIFKEQSQ